MKDVKKYRRSAFSIVCYVLAALMLIYVCYQIGSTVNTINEYYAQYGMSAQPSEYFTYCLQTALEPMFYTVVLFMFGYILDAVRKLDPANYKSEEDIIEEEEAKRQAREARKLARGEAAAVKAGNVTTEENSVEADFAKSLDEELRADGRKSGGNGNRKPRNNNSNRNGSGKGGSGKNAGAAADVSSIEADFTKSLDEELKSDGKKTGDGSGNRKPRNNNSNRNGSNKGGSGKNGSGNNNRRRSGSRKPAAEKTDDKAQAASGDVFEAVVTESADNE